MTGDDDFTIEDLKIDGKTFRSGDRVKERTSRRKPRKPFKAQYVKLPMRWIETLPRAKGKNTILLAHTILAEAFKRENIGGDIVLSAAVTGMPHSTRTRAIKELVELGLIKIKQDGKQAARVWYIYSKKK